MASKIFTAEEMDLLRESPFVLDVSPSIVHFSVRFKEQFWKRLQEGKKAQDIVKDLGIDPQLLGENRITGLKTSIRREAKSGKGFQDLETRGAKPRGYTNPDVMINYLEQQIAYKDQEIEFLKKIASLSAEVVES